MEIYWIRAKRTLYVYTDSNILLHQSAICKIHIFLLLFSQFTYILKCVIGHQSSLIIGSKIIYDWKTLKTQDFVILQQYNVK